VVLSMARMGADLDAVASFHGALGQLPPPAQGGVKARVLVLNGADDPMVTKDQIAAFEKDMTAAGAKFELVNLKGAKHSFTNPDAAKAGMDALAYNAEADKESWDRLLKMLREVFGS
jgi:dienelactone hydrolase